MHRDGRATTGPRQAPAQGVATGSDAPAPGRRGPTGRNRDAQPVAGPTPPRSHGERLVRVSSSASKALLREGLEVVRRLCAGESLAQIADAKRKTPLALGWAAKRALSAALAPDDTSCRSIASKRIAEIARDRKACERQAAKIEQALSEGGTVYLPQTPAQAIDLECNEDIAEAMLQAVSGGAQADRDLAVLSMVFGAGLWMIDIASLRVGDVLGQDGRLKYKVTVGHRRRPPLCQWTSEGNAAPASPDHGFLATG